MDVDLVRLSHTQAMRAAMSISSQVFFQLTAAMSTNVADAAVSAR
jgi:hypothetical protein